jgi:hypothetical protein
MIGPVVKMRPPQLGTVLAQKAQTGAPALAPRPPRPVMHRNGAPPTMAYHKHHPMLTSPAAQPALPGGNTGPNQHAVDAYLKVLRGNQ